MVNINEWNIIPYLVQEELAQYLTDSFKGLAFLLTQAPVMSCMITITAHPSGFLHTYATERVYKITSNDL